MVRADLDFEALAKEWFIIHDEEDQACDYYLNMQGTIDEFIARKEYHSKLDKDEEFFTRIGMPKGAFLKILEDLGLW